MIRMGVVATVLLVGTIAAVAAEVPVGRWLATEIGGVGVADGVETTLEIRPDGRIAGAGGCNGYGAKATFGTGTVAVGPLISTRMACPGPAMDQQARFEAALAGASRWRIEARTLTFAAADGRVLVRFAAVP